MRPQRERAAYSLLTVNHRDRDGPFVTRGGADTLEHLGRHVLVVAVDDDCFKSPASQLPDRRISIAAVINGNFQVTEDPAQYPYDLFVGTQNQRLQTHLSPNSARHIQPPMAAPSLSDSSSLSKWATLRSCSA